MHTVGESDDDIPKNQFDFLLQFLKGQENLYEQLELLYWDDPRHTLKLYLCKNFKFMYSKDQEKTVNIVEACTKCLEVHQKSIICTSEFLCRNLECKICPSHHYYLCLTTGVIPKESKAINKWQKCRSARRISGETLTWTFTWCLHDDRGLEDVPVNKYWKSCTLIDLASDTNYITHAVAETIKSTGWKCHTSCTWSWWNGDLRRNKKILVKSQDSQITRYLQFQQILCYGLKPIGDIEQHVSERPLYIFFQRSKWILNQWPCLCSFKQHCEHACILANYNLINLSSLYPG